MTIAEPSFRGERICVRNHKYPGLRNQESSTACCERSSARFGLDTERLRLRSPIVRAVGKRRRFRLLFAAKLRKKRLRRGECASVVTTHHFSHPGYTHKIKSLRSTVDLVLSLGKKHNSL